MTYSFVFGIVKTLWYVACKRLLNVLNMGNAL